MGKFSAFYAELYDQQYPVIPDELPRLLDCVRQIRGPILEAMCGSGRLLIPLCEQKIPVEGMDICPFMLDVCRGKLRSKSFSSNLYLQSIEQMNLPHRYNLIFILAKSLCMLKKEQLPSVFEKIYDHLNPGGIFIFDLWAIIEPNLTHTARDKRKFKKMDGSTIFREEEVFYDPLRSIYHERSRYKSIRGGEQTVLAEDAIEIQLYDKNKILQIIKEIGFSLLHLFDHAYYAKINDFIFLKKHFWIECVKRVSPINTQRVSNIGR